MSNLLLGKKAIIEHLNKDKIISVHSLTLIPEIKKICDKKNIIYKIENKKFFENFSSNHQGIIAYIKNSDYLTNDIETFMERVKNSSNENKIILILDMIEDVGNFGAIIRTCVAFNVDGIIIKKNNQAKINDHVIKSSVGTIYNSNILRIPNLNNAIKYLKENNFWIIATTLDNSNELNKMKFDYNVCIILGNEQNGVSKNLIQNADYKMSIKMHGNVESLNVSVAAGIILNYIRNYHSKE